MAISKSGPCSPHNVGQLTDLELMRMAVVVWYCEKRRVVLGPRRDHERPSFGEAEHFKPGFPEGREIKSHTMGSPSEIGPSMIAIG